MKTITIIAVLFCLGCATTLMNVITMTNPKTGKSVYVSHGSWGWDMASLSAAQQERQKRAIEAVGELGFTEME
ncbi:MAG: hypothetical protein L6277_07120 [Desulfobacterales bacterium]|nr:hypothetical protein [Desulfobacterales bacterium]